MQDSYLDDLIQTKMLQITNNKSEENLSLAPQNTHAKIHPCLCSRFREERKDHSRSRGHMTVVIKDGEENGMEEVRPHGRSVHGSPH